RPRGPGAHGRVPLQLRRPRMIAHEVNFDGLVGPTHSYAGLSYGNIASQAHRHAASNPKAAALEGLAKMKLLAGLGLRQAVLPPRSATRGRPTTPACPRTTAPPASSCSSTAGRP